ncbi:MAG: chromosome segregation protein SMC [Candidatus Omnitrophota bacterium]|nr:MAG: chromosome segregation protein SMC [Candidatus Omnitrophota bacterium]
MRQKENSMLGDKKFIRTLKIRNLLSFGVEDQTIGLESLNVLIGPNASGKSNLIESLILLKEAPKDILLPIREGGGIGDWLWKGQDSSPIAEINVTVDFPEGNVPLRYVLKFTMVGQRMEIEDEIIENEQPFYNESEAYFYFRYRWGIPYLNVREKLSAPVGEGTGRVERKLKKEALDLRQSVLSQRKDPDQYPELTYLSHNFSKFKFYRNWIIGRYTPARLPQNIDNPEDFLLEDASNLGLVLNDLYHQGFREPLLDHLRTFFPAIDDISTRIHGGTIQIFLHEKGSRNPIPATRLSDGTIRFLCLLTILCHPSPPPLICIEEPEMGLHPDALPIIAELLVEASHRTQLVVTTHSDSLISALTHVPECILVCEKELTGTTLRRLEKDALQKWLETYSLGALWRMGEIGGNP